jgi:hypothetical protein
MLLEFAENFESLYQNREAVQSLMRGPQEISGSLPCDVSIAERIPASFPLWRIRKLADQALDRLNPTFCRL